MRVAIQIDSGILCFMMAPFFLLLFLRIISSLWTFTTISSLMNFRAINFRSFSFRLPASINALVFFFHSNQMAFHSNFILWLRLSVTSRNVCIKMEIRLGCVCVQNWITAMINAPLWIIEYVYMEVVFQFLFRINWCRY